MQRMEQVDDLGTGAPVEVAGRLIGQQHRRLGHQRSGDRGALAFTARQPAGTMLAAVRQADSLQALSCAAASRTLQTRLGTAAARATLSSALIVSTRWNCWKTKPIIEPRIADSLRSPSFDTS